MRAEIISVGTELLLGDIVNTNAQFLAQQLAAMGFTVYYQTVVGDNATRLRQLVSEARERSDVLVFTGGLGPTDDDLTKETVAEAFADRLVMDEEELAKLEAMFKGRGRVMTDNNRKQAMVPMRGGKMPNPNGTAPGVFFHFQGKYAFLLPGPPREMQPMFMNEVIPKLEELQDGAIRSVVLQVFGVGESELEDKVRDLLGNSNPTAALYAKTGEVHIRVTAKGPTAEQADLMCDEYAQLFRDILGDLIYAENGDNLETTVVKLLLQQSKTLATAESCTGGLLGERITSVPGSSGMYGFGAITYANEAKHEMLGVKSATLRKYGAVSGQVAAEMAFGTAAKGLADYGIGITGIAGPGGGSDEKPVGLVYVALAAGREVYVKRLRMRTANRGFVRTYATQVALDMLRRKATGLPIPDAKRFTKSQQADYERIGRPRRKGGALARGILAVVLILAVLALVIAGFYIGGQFTGDATPGGGGSAATPSAQGLRYGTVEYTSAACALVANAALEQPSVVGFLALPNADMEQLVAQAGFSGQDALEDAADETAVRGLAVMGAEASPSTSASNTAVLGGTGFGALQSYRTGNADALPSTFTYYTAREARVYQVFSFYLADAGEVRSDGFVPAVPRLATYDAYLEFVLGAKARSLYDFDVDLQFGDSFMTLMVADPASEGRYVCLLGRLTRSGERSENNTQATTAGEALMPLAWYEQNGVAAPNQQSLFDGWMRWYLSRETDNQSLQLAAGIPAADTLPVVYDPLEPAAATLGRSGAFAEPDSSVPEDDSGANSGTEDADDSTASADGSAPEDSSASQAATQPEEEAPQARPSDPTRLTVTMNGEVITDTPLNILAQICQKEAAGSGTAAIQAVAIAAHSWILNQQGAGEAAPRVAGASPSPEVLAAVRPVAHQFLSADGANPACTPFYSMAASGSNTAENLWGTARSYLVGVSSPYDQNRDDWRRVVALSQESIAQAALEKMGLDLSELEQPEAWFSGLVRDANGYVESLVLGDVTLTGAEVWGWLLAEDGVPLLPSPAFEVEYDGSQFVFICNGEGHGVGMSLEGAFSYAREGWDTQRILAYYYPGTSLLARE